MVNVSFLTLIIIIGIIDKNHSIKISINNNKNDFIELPRFWTNTGLSPPPLSNDTIKFLQTYDVKINLDLIGSLPNHGLSHVRTHWILNLITVK